MAEEIGAMLWKSIQDDKIDKIILLELVEEIGKMLWKSIQSLK